MGHMKEITGSKWFWLTGAAALTVLGASPAAGLLCGSAIAMASGNPCQSFTAKASKYLLQGSVILLGFGLAIGAVMRIGYSSVWITLVGISFTLSAGYLLGRLLGVGRDISLLISCGTAICGGSAIAAVAPAIGASRTDTAVSLSAVFLLNAVALLVFPHIGHYFLMDQRSFGLWSAMAIHDTSSVVGAASTYGAVALGIATTVKLTRALWILPVSFVCARQRRTGAGPAIPWFLLGFLAAALARGLMPGLQHLWDVFSELGRHFMSGALFLVGAGLTVRELRQIGIMPLVTAGILWLTVSAVSLFVVLRFGLRV